MATLMMAILTALGTTTPNRLGAVIVALGALTLTTTLLIARYKGGTNLGADGLANVPYPSDLRADESDLSSGATRPAPHVARAAAWLADASIVTLVVIGVPTAFRPALLIGTFITYQALLVWLVHQTIGKALFGLKVIRLGKAPSVWWAFGRSSAGYFLIDLVGVGVLCALLDPRHRCLHDLVFGSEVQVEQEGRLSLSVALRRLTEFAERQKEAAEQKKKSVLVLAALWGAIRALADSIRRIIEVVTGISGGSAPVSGSSAVGALPAQAATAIAVTATVASIAAVAYLPPVRAATESLFIAREIPGKTSRPAAGERASPPPTQPSTASTTPPSTPRRYAVSRLDAYALFPQEEAERILGGPVQKGLTGDGARAFGDVAFGTVDWKGRGVLDLCVYGIDAERSTGIHSREYFERSVWVFLWDTEGDGKAPLADAQTRGTPVSGIGEEGYFGYASLMYSDPGRGEAISVRSGNLLIEAYVLRVANAWSVLKEIVTSIMRRL